MGALAPIGWTKPTYGRVTIGADIGQRRDPTALCVAEVEERGNVAHHVIRHLARLPLGTSYPDVATRVTELATAVVAKTQETPTLYVDATGVGQPLVDVLRLANPPVQLYGCYFSHGDRRSVEGNDVKIGKAWLVARLQVLLQSKRLHLPSIDDARVLADELLNYEIRIDENANDRYGAFAVGTHDDFVTALGLACQVDSSGLDIWFVGREPWDS